MLNKLESRICLASAAIDWVPALFAPSDELSKLDIHLDGDETLCAPCLHKPVHEYEPGVVFEWQQVAVDADGKKLELVASADPKDADLGSSIHISP